MENQRIASIGIQARSSSKVGLKHLVSYSQDIERNRKPNYMPFLFKAKRTQLANSCGTPAPGQYQSKSSFEVRDRRDELAENYKVELSNSKIIKQNAIFKSSSKRFNYRQREEVKEREHMNTLGGFGDDVKKVIEKMEKYHQILEKKSKTMSHLQSIHSGEKQLGKEKVYPSIPDRKNRFGYCLQDGGLNKINKNLIQIEKQKESMKSYMKRLTHERRYSKNSECFELLKNEIKFKMVQREKQKLQKLGLSKTISNPKKDQQNLSMFSEKKTINKKPCLNPTAKCDGDKVQKYFEEKDNLNSSLGPGKYQINSKFQDNQKKNVRFQFFNSTEARFKDYPAQESPRPQKRQITSSAAPQKSNRPVFGVKHKLNFSRKSNIQKLNILPGPGDYDPKDSSIRKSLKTRGEFSKSARWKYRNQRQMESLDSEENPNENITVRNFRMIRRKNCKGILKDLQLQHPQESIKEQNFQPFGGKASREQKIRTKKLRRTRKDEGNKPSNKFQNGFTDQSYYSLCSWEQNPQSRVEGIRANNLNFKTDL